MSLKYNKKETYSTECHNIIHVFVNIVATRVLFVEYTREKLV